MLNVGDAVLTFLSDTTQLDQAFARIPDQADRAMSAAADSVDQVGDSLKGVSFELDATAQNAAYAGGMIKESLDKANEGFVDMGSGFSSIKQGFTGFDTIPDKLQPIEEGGKKIGYSFREARGGIMLVGEQLGVHLPRELTMLLAHIPLVGQAFSTMLPLIGVVAAIGLIGELIAKHEKLVQAQRKEAEENSELAITQQDMVLGLKNANLAIEDQIRKLQGRPAQNQLVITLNEVKVAADALATRFAEDFTKMDAVLEEQVGIWATLKSNALAALAALTPELVMAGWEKGVNQQIAGNKLIQDSVKQVENSLDKLHEAQRRLADQDPNKNLGAWRVAAGEVSTAFGNVESAADSAAGAVKKFSPDAHELLARLTAGAIQAKAGWQSMNEKIANAGEELKKVHQEISNDQAERQAKDAARALAEQLEAIKRLTSAQHDFYEHGEISQAEWLAAEIRGKQASEIANEDYLKKLVSIYTRAGDAEKAKDAQGKLDIATSEHQREAQEALNAALDKSRERLHKVAEEYGHLIDADVEKSFLGVQKATQELTRADEELAKAQGKLTEAKLSEFYKDQEGAITKLAQMHLITEEQKDDRLKLLQQQQANAAIAILSDQLNREKALMEAQQARIATLKLSPGISPEQVIEAEAALKKLETAVTNTETQIVQAQEKANQQSEANDKSHYGRALLEAMAFGNQLVAEQMRANHTALLAAEGELAQAKARGMNTAAIEKEIEALKKNEQALEKEANGGRVSQTEKQKYVKEALASAQAALADAKAHGADTTALQQNVNALLGLEKSTQQVTSGDKARLAALLQINKAQQLAAQQVLLLAKEQGLDTTAIEQNIKALKQQQIALNLENQELPRVNRQMVELKTSVQEAATTMVNSLSTAMASVIKGQESFGAAMEKATLGMLGQMAQHWAQYYLALAIGSLWTDPGAAAEEFAAAAALEVLAGAMSGLAGGGGSSSSSGVQQGPGVGQTTSSGGGGGNQTTGVTKLAAGGVVSKPTTFMAGDSPSGGEAEEAILPLTDPTAMRKIADAINAGNSSGFTFASSSTADAPAAAKTVGDALGLSMPRPSYEGLGFTKSSSSTSAKPEFNFSQPSAGERPGFDFSAPSIPREMPDVESLAAHLGGLLSQSTLRAASDSQVPAAAAAAASAGPPPVDIDSRMEQFAERLGSQLQPEGASSAGAGQGDTHVHVNFPKGAMISPDNLGRVVKKINRMVNNRQTTLKATNSLRVTRRSQ